MDVMVIRKPYLNEGGKICHHIGFVSPKKIFSYAPTIEWEFYSKNYSLIMHEKVFTFEEKVKKYENMKVTEQLLIFQKL